MVVSSIVGNGGKGIGVRGDVTITSDITLSTSYYGKIIYIDSPTTIKITIPANLPTGGFIGIITPNTSALPKVIAANGVYLDDVLTGFACAAPSMMMTISCAVMNEWYSEYSFNFFDERNPIFFDDQNANLQGSNMVSPYTYTSSGVGDKLYFNRAGVVVANEANKPVYVYDPETDRYAINISRATLAQRFTAPMDFTNAAWVKTNAAITASAAELAAATYPFASLTCDSATGVIAHTMEQTIPYVASSGRMTKAIWVAVKDTGAIPAIGLLGGQSGAYVKTAINLNTGVSFPFSSLSGAGISDINDDAVVVKKVKNATDTTPAIFRIEITFIVTASADVDFRIYLHNGTTHLFEGTAGLGIYILAANSCEFSAWGATINPTTTAQTADAISHSNAGIYAQTNGTIYAEISSGQFSRGIDNGSREIIALHATSSPADNILSCRVSYSSGLGNDVIDLRLRVGASNLFTITDTIPLGQHTIVRLAFTYSQTTYSLSVNGRIVEATPASNIAIPATFTQLALGGRDGGSGQRGLNLLRFRRMNYTISNAQLTALTAA